MNSKSWIHSWYVDLPLFHLVPLFTSVFFLIYFSYRPFEVGELYSLLALLGIIDWGHFASIWPRIFNNPAETTKRRLLFTGFFLLIVLSYITLCYFVKERAFLLIVIVYLSVFHVIRQQFGFIRMYSKTDGKKSRIDELIEKCLIYLSMVTPLIFWHYKNDSPQGIWFREFVENELFIWAFYPALFFYIFSFIGYLYFEIQRSRKNQQINYAKNLSILATMVSWVVISFLPENGLVVAFTVQLHHNVSYVAVVWLIGRRDKELISGKLSPFSLYSIPGFFLYMCMVLVAGQILYVTYMELNYDQNSNYLLIGTLLNWIPRGEGVIEHLGRGIFFSTQIHHFIVDAFLWKKEKDYLFVHRMSNSTDRVASPV